MCGGPHFVSHCPSLTQGQKAQLFLQTEGSGVEDEDGGGDDHQDYGVDGEEMDGVCGLNAARTPKLGSLVRPGCTFAQVARETLHEDRCYLDSCSSFQLDSCSSFHQVFTRKHLSDVTKMMTRLKGDCNAGTTYSSLKG